MGTPLKDSQREANRRETGSIHPSLPKQEETSTGAPRPAEDAQLGVMACEGRPVPSGLPSRPTYSYKPITPSTQALPAGPAAAPPSA